MEKWRIEQDEMCFCEVRGMMVLRLLHGAGRLD